MASLSDGKLFPRLAEGMTLVAEHALKIESAVHALEEAGHARGAASLRGFAEEEAAKFLILLDAARCPRRAQKLRAGQLDRFHDHLARGLYVEVYDMSPADYREVRRYVNTLRKSHYLDGPNDIDWIFRNTVLARREESLYVDLVQDDDGATAWHSPAIWDDIGLRSSSPVLELVASMSRAGFATKEALECVASLWRDVPVNDSLHWRDISSRNEETLERLCDAGLASEATTVDLRRIVETWSFPLHSLDLRLEEVDIETLRKRQQAWMPDW